MRDKELRLALVCYGGISLAIYMHGITKEIWRLARASKAVRDGKHCPDGSEHVYCRMFDEIANSGQINLRAMVDIVAGASAGGINGIFLAQAIATGQSLEPLTDMWLEVADIEALLSPDRAPGSKMTKFWALPIAWMMARREAGIEEDVDPATRDEVRGKLEKFVRSQWFEPPFGGEQFLHLLFNALDAMAETSGERLLPPGQPLDLFVTLTDFGGHPERLRLNSPPEVVETEHRLVCSFTDRGLGPVTQIAHPAELTFAARGTSSFPGAFPPFTIAELDRVTEEREIDWPSRDAFLERILPRQYAANALDTVALIDGSVLANAPFKPAIDALRQRPARRQVDRRFVFIDPVPDMRFGINRKTGETPGFFQTIIGALSELPRQQPIRDNLEAIDERSRRIERMLGIIDKIREEVEAQVVSLFGYTLFLDYPTPKRLSAWRRRAQISAANKAGYSHTAYGRLKVDGMIDRLTDLLLLIADQSGPADRRRVRRAVTKVVQERGYDDFATSHPSGVSPAALEFLRAHDLSFRIRRLRLLLRRITELDSEYVSAELTPMRDAAYEALADYLELERAQHYADLRKQVRAMKDDAGDVLDAIAQRMDLQALDMLVDARLAEGMSKLSRETRRPVLLSYLGFSFFDLATLPLLQGEGLGEYDPIRVDRISPDDATAIRSGGAQATLKGIQFNTFGAFFSRSYRENDYLWGRLHGADRLVDIVLSTLTASTRLPPGRVLEIKRAAFRAILDEEEPRLTQISSLIEQLRGEIG
ncbi:patatin-related protein [Stakelama sediminis]|uniref:Patatin-related protein n=1 Tax=Stakelama sediminis TaxID=463200 RepID=A0A840YUL9_9SPHN|nr:patatin-like protein [Stakelama sediminis]MBB5717267.1 patatin-related protein [Stakelama sediminis]